MRRYKRISTILHVIVLYCFVLSLCYSKALIVNPAFSANHPADHRSHFTVVSTDILCNPTNSRNFVQGFNQLPVVALKNSLNVFLACTKVAEMWHVNRYNKYLFYANCSIHWFHTTDIIFPFHYFW